MKFARLLNPSIRNLHEFTDMSRLLLNISLIEPGEGGHQKKRTPLIFICQTQAAGGPLPVTVWAARNPGQAATGGALGSFCGFCSELCRPAFMPKAPNGCLQKTSASERNDPKKDPKLRARTRKYRVDLWMSSRLPVIATCIAECLVL